MTRVAENLDRAAWRSLMPSSEVASMGRWEVTIIPRRLQQGRWGQDYQAGAGAVPVHQEEVESIILKKIAFAKAVETGKSYG
ncbi:unnamed protein product [Gulo gulo]|uniref:Uncharacterized protein n=1 Tax=Gulo gulo TaxID=48420 RepID=A0A9X9PU36_GULGU|nr:unnamed protein product [Gulo gulo]